MADVTMTVNSDKTITLSTQSLGSQGERVSVDVVVPAAVAALGYEAYIDFLLPDGTSYYKGGYDCSSELFTVGLGETDSVMDKDGEVQLQFWVGTIVAAVKTVYWATAIKKTKVNQSIGATSAAILPYLPQMVIPASYPAANISLEDAANRFTAAQVEAALAEIAGPGRIAETVKANATSIGTLASLTTTEKTNLVGSINEVDARLDAQTIVGYDATHNGKIKLDNGYMRIWGEYPCASMASDGGTGGYSATIALNDTFIGNPVGYATFRYASGGAYAFTHTISTTQIKIGSNVNASGAFVGWCVEGLWK